MDSSRYLPFGGLRVEPDEDLTDRGYTDHRHATRLGLIDMRARWQDPTIGRFLSPDSIVPDPAEPQSHNRFSYVNNRPLNHQDPKGHFSEEVHYNLTFSVVYYAALYYASQYQLANAREMANDLAVSIADANQAVDSIRQNPQYKSTDPGTPHWYNHAQATTWLQEAVDTGDQKELGEALHALQDYFSHFGQGFIAERGDDGETRYEELLGLDDREPFVTEEEWRDRSRAWGHGTYGRWWTWDEFDWNDSRCELMVRETIAWIHAFLRAYFERDYGDLPPPYNDPWLHGVWR